VYDAQGRRVRNLLTGETYPAGRHTVRWDGTDDTGRALGSGVYLFRMQVGSERVVMKGVLLK
jgi:flagellar hook assembly protein FlgD